MLDVIQNLKPYFINFHANKIWTQKLNVIKKTRAFRSCEPETKSFLLSLSEDSEFRVAFEAAPNSNVGLNLMQKLCSGMISDNDSAELFSRSICCASIYMKNTYESLGLEHVPPMGSKNREALQRKDYLNNSDSEKCVEYFEANGMSLLGEHLRIQNASFYLLEGAKNPVAGLGEYRHLVVEYGFNDLCREYINFCININSGMAIPPREYVFTKLADVFQMMEVVESSAYAQYSLNQESFFDYRIELERFKRARWEWFWKMALIRNWYPYTYSDDENVDL